MDDTSLANAIVDLFKNFYTVYLTDFNWKKHGYSPFPGTIINYENGMGEICDYYNNIAGMLDKQIYSNTELKAHPIKLQGDGIKEFQNELNALSSDDLRLFLGKLLDFIKVYKLDTLNDFTQCRNVIENNLKEIEGELACRNEADESKNESYSVTHNVFNNPIEIANRNFEKNLSKLKSVFSLDENGYFGKRIVNRRTHAVITEIETKTPKETAELFLI